MSSVEKEKLDLLARHIHVENHQDYAQVPRLHLCAPKKRKKKKMMQEKEKEKAEVILPRLATSYRRNRRARIVDSRMTPLFGLVEVVYRGEKTDDIGIPRTIICQLGQ